MMHHYQQPRNNNNPNQPMSNRLQQQLQQQKLQQQHEALLGQGGGGNRPPAGGNTPSAGMDPRQQKKLQQLEEEENKPKVLTNWWSWMAFLATCCIPNWFMRVCMRMPNPLTQQAWREKVLKKKIRFDRWVLDLLLIFIFIVDTLLHDSFALWCFSVYYLWSHGGIMSNQRIQFGLFFYH
jgi:hypothetical protein